MGLSKYLIQQQSNNKTALTERAKAGKNTYIVQGYLCDLMLLHLK